MCVTGTDLVFFSTIYLYHTCGTVALVVFVLLFLCVYVAIKSQKDYKGYGSVARNCFYIVNFLFI